MDEETKYADMVEIPVDTCTVTVKKPTKRGRRKASAEKVKERVIEKVNDEALAENAALDVVMDTVAAEAADAVDGQDENGLNANDSEVSTSRDERSVAEADNNLLEEYDSGLRELKQVLSEENIETEPTVKRGFIGRLFSKRKKNGKEDFESIRQNADGGERTDAIEDTPYNAEDFFEESFKNGVEAENGYSPTVNITEKKPPVKKTKLKTFAQVTAACALVASVVALSVFGESLGVGKLFAGVFKNDADVIAPYTDYEITLPCLSGGVTLEDGILSVAKKGSVYPSMDGKVTTVTLENGKYSVEVEYADNLRSVYDGLDHSYFAVGDIVYRKVPLGYSNGEKYTVCFYSGDELLTDYGINSDRIVWNAVSVGEEK